MTVQTDTPDIRLEGLPQVTGDAFGFLRSVECLCRKNIKLVRSNLTPFISFKRRKSFGLHNHCVIHVLLMLHWGNIAISCELEVHLMNNHNKPKHAKILRAHQYWPGQHKLVLNIPGLPDCKTSRVLPSILSFPPKQDLWSSPRKHLEWLFFHAQIREFGRGRCCFPLLIVRKCIQTSVKNLSSFLKGVIVFLVGNKQNNDHPRVSPSLWRVPSTAPQPLW